MAEPRPDLDDLAGRLVAARQPGAPLVENAAGAILGGLDDCYAVQRAVVQALGPAGGFKTARKAGQPRIIAPILAQDVRHGPAVFRPDALRLIGIELEVGFLVTAPLPDPAAPGFDDLARRCVAAVPVIEIVDTRFADLAEAADLLRLADNQINGGLVVGTPRDDWETLDLATPEARLALGERIVLDGPARVPGGDAYGGFCGLAQTIGAHCGGLRPGHVVITGSLNGMPFVERGTAVRGEIAGLGAVSVDFPA